MAFVTPLLLAGVALIAVPIVLHLRRRQEPVRVEFPALRLLKRNQQRNQTRLRVRRLLLLAARCALLAALAAALARPLWLPSIDQADAAEAGPAGRSPAIAIVIDNGPNAAYESANQTRLDAAKAEARWLLGQVPATTPTVAADRSPSGTATTLDAGSASPRVERLAIAGGARPLATVVSDAVARLAETPASRRVAFVFTDLSAGAWDETAQADLAVALERHAGIELRLVNVGARLPRNDAVAELRVENASLALGEPLRLTARIEATGGDTRDATVELWVASEDAPIKRDQRLVSLTPGEPSELAFTLAGLDEGFHTGALRIAGIDGAPTDNARHFAVEVRRPRSVLLVESSADGARFVRAVIDPPAAERGAARPIETEVILKAAWPRHRLVGYDAVVLVDPSPGVAAARGWRRLYDFAAGGGGVGVVLGPAATLDAMNTPAAQTVLPGPLAWRSRDATHVGTLDASHPLCEPLAPYAEAAPWPLFPVYQRWELDGLAAGAVAPVRYEDGAPMIVERAVGRGRVAVVTTSLAEPRNDPDAWNELLTGDEPWPGLLLVESLARYLADGVDAPLQYLAGQIITTRLPRGVETPAVVLRTPTGEAIRQPATPGRDEVTLAGLTEPGSYRVEAGGERSLVDRRFVVNLHPRDTRLERVDTDELVERLGPTRVRLIADREALAAALDLGSSGVDLSGWVLALAALALGAEQVLSRGDAGMARGVG